MSKPKKPASKPPAVAAPSTLVADELVTEAEYRRILLSQTRKSPDNRKRFDEQNLTELAASIKAMGVVQPILVRPVTPTAEQPEIYEIVAGERRYRGSVIAGLLDIPAMVRVLSDADAAKIRILENLQREDPHPMEEAEGYQLLMLQHGYNADQLADEIKKSRAYIYGRLKLCALTLEVREEFMSNKVSASTALLIARIPVPTLQIKALNHIQRPHGGMSAGPLSHRDAAYHIQQNYMLDLAGAVFKITDAKLLPDAGACGPCPKRAGNQPEVFEGIGANVCTDPVCYSAKKAAHHAASIVAANKMGIPIAEASARQAIHRDQHDNDSDLVRADTHITRFPRNAPATKNAGSPKLLLADEALPPVATYTKEGDGSLIAWYKRTAMQAALETAGLCETVEQHAERMAKAESDPYMEPVVKSAHTLKWEHDRDTAEAETVFRMALYKKMREHGATQGFSLDSLRAFTKRAVCILDLPDLGDMHDFDTSSDATICAHVDGAGLPEIQLLLIDLLLGSDLTVATYEVQSGRYLTDKFSTVSTMARHEGIDPDALREEMFPTPINVDDATQASLAAFVTKYPARVNELKDVVLAHPRYDLVRMLELAAKDTGYTYTTTGFEKLPPLLIGVDLTPAVDTTTPATAAAAQDDDIACDGASLAEQIEQPAPAKLPKARASKKPLPADPSAWPFPKSSASVTDPKPAPQADTTSTDTESTQELTA